MKTKTWARYVWMVLWAIGLCDGGEMRVWRAVGGFQTEAEFVKYDAGVVTLKKKNGKEIEVGLGKLIPRHRMEVLKLAGNQTAGGFPQGEIQAPTGRRELVFNRLEAGDHWPSSITPAEKEALLKVDRKWNHAESRFFVIHYKKLGYARRVARMADFLYLYIASDLPGYEDRVEEKSHIVVVADMDDWREFLKYAETAPEWSGAYVRGMVMFVPDSDDRKRNAHVVAHEMSHLVLNRFFVHPPPLWLNEGLAEWYGHFGWQAFKGQNVNVERSIGDLEQPFPVAQLMGMRSIQGNIREVSRYYATSHQLVGMLKLRKDPADFVKFLQGVTVEGKPVKTPLEEVYGLGDTAAFQEAFDAFLE